MMETREGEREKKLYIHLGINQNLNDGKYWNADDNDWNK